MAFRIYVDESGDHTLNAIENPSRRYLGLTGVVFRKSSYSPTVPQDLEELKLRHFSYDVDKPFTLTRSEIKKRRSHFWVLRDPERRQRWEDDLLRFLNHCPMQVFTVVYDKLADTSQSEPTLTGPYDVSLAALLDCIGKWLQSHEDGVADILLESRNKTLDDQLRAAYSRLRSQGTVRLAPADFKVVYPSNDLLFGRKGENIAGLQIADLLAAEQKMLTVMESGRPLSGAISGFGQRINSAIADKVNAQGRILIQK